MSNYFVSDPECGDEFYETADEAKKEAELILDFYRDASGDGWDECVTSLCWGIVLEECNQTKCEPAPKGSEFDEIWDFGLVPTEAGKRIAGLEAKVAELERQPGNRSGLVCKEYHEQAIKQAVRQAADRAVNAIAELFIDPDVRRDACAEVRRAIMG